jgi:hypothetical protein
MRSLRLVCSVLLMVVPPLAHSLAQAAPAPDPWAPARFLLGSWEGTSTGHSGTATVKREYRFALRERFIEERSTSTYAPQEQNPRGEVHEHISYISYDRARRALVLRQFHVERFVIQYAQDSATTAALAFSSESMENTPSGWRARETYIVHGADEFEEVFELAQAGKPFDVYSRTRLKRVR